MRAKRLAQNLEAVDKLFLSTENGVRSCNECCFKSRKVKRRATFSKNGKSAVMRRALVGFCCRWSTMVESEARC